MVRNYRISRVSIDESEAFVRVAELSAGNHSYGTLSKSLSPQYSLISQQISIKAINEIYLFMNLSKLRELDDDSDKQEAFIRTKAKDLSGDHINIVFVNIFLNNGDTLTQIDIGYVNDLLMWSENDIYVVPALSFSDNFSREDRVELYESFVNDLLTMKNSTVSGKLTVGMTIPTFYSRPMLESLYKLYEGEKDAPSFVAMDFGNNRISSPTVQQKVSYTHRLFKQQREEKYFLYGLRVKDRRRGPAPTDAEDLGALLAGIGAIGRSRRYSRVRMPPIPFTWDSLLTVSQNDYAYGKLIGDTTRQSEFNTFLSSFGVASPSLAAQATGTDKKYAHLIKDFNRFNLNSISNGLATDVVQSNSQSLRKKLKNKAVIKHAKAIRDRSK